MSSRLLKTMTIASVALAAQLAVVGAHAAGARVATGGYGDLQWTAQSMLVGATATNAGHGNTVYTGAMPAYSGTVGLLMGGFVCSGTLLADRVSILTAGHCVADTSGNQDVADDGVTVFFRTPGSGPDVQLYYGGPGYTTVQSSNVFVHSAYTGDVIDHNDIAVVRLSAPAPDFAESYALHSGNSLRGETVNITGYGSTSSIGGAVGVNTVNPNRLGWFRQGQNITDFRLGDDIFGGAWAPIMNEPASQISHSYLIDFDNGTTTNDAACRITQASNFGGVPGTTFCQTGLGATEVGVAGGDSGGGSFINGEVVAVNSYGITFGAAWGDYAAGLNSSWGEFSGLVPVYYHRDWIAAQMIPEPGTWALMLAGFAAVGAVVRRRRAQA